jgi:PAS domain S-box-containing protein
MHELLLRQLQRAGASVEEASPALAKVLELVSEAYGAADTERALTARSLEHASSELLDRDRALRSERDARQQAHEAVARGQREFRDVIEGIPFAVFVRRGTRIVFTNDTTVRSLGYDDASQIIGRSIVEFVHPTDRERVMKSMSQFDVRGAPLAASIEYLALRRDGGTAVFERTTVMEIMFEGEPAALLILNDVTDRKKMLTRLQLTDRMASIGTLAAGVAHEINNPLAYVVSNLAYVAEVLGQRKSPDGVIDWEELRKAIADATEGASRVRQIVSSLKTFSRGDEERSGPVELAGVLLSAVEMCRNQVRHRAKLVIEVSGSPAVEGNAVRLGQVFVNLLVNAAQALPDGAADTNEIRVSTSRDASGRVVVAVSDTGCGMSPEIMAHIFEPFFTTKPVGMGTGLGLAICHGIVASMGGELEVDSKPGRGTTFRVILRPSSVTTAPPAPAAVPRGAPDRARILVVDDEAAVGSALRRLLGREHDVVAVTSSRAALALLSEGQRFDVIGCDLMMPDLSGMEFYEEVAKTFPWSAERFFFMTGGTFTPQAQAFLERTSLTRLDKPFDSESLRETVRAIAARK